MRKRISIVRGLICYVGLSALIGCGSGGQKSERLLPNESSAALLFGAGQTRASSASEYVAAVSGETGSVGRGYYRNVECTAALEGLLAEAERRISRSDPRLPPFRKAVSVFRGRALRAGKMEGYSDRRVLEEIARAGSPVSDEREEDLVKRQSQQAMLCLSELT